MTDTPPREFTPEFWLQYGDDPEPSTREKMILLGLHQIIEVGPVDFNAALVCEMLGIKRPMITYYFGSKEKFVAEITWTAYLLWAENVDRIIRAAPADGRARLTAFVEGEVEWARRMGCIHTLINYPMLSSKSMVVLVDEHQEEMKAIFEYHLALVTQIVRDIRRGSTSSFDYDKNSIPRLELLVPPQHFLTATQISWATHGLASWSSGRHVATWNIENPAISSLTKDFAVGQMVKTIVAMAG